MTSRERKNFALLSQKTLTLTSYKIITACNNSNLTFALRIIFMGLSGKHNHKNPTFGCPRHFKGTVELFAEYKNRYYVIIFQVVDMNVLPILGVPTCEALTLVQ